MVLLVEFSLQLLIDALVLLAGHEERRQAEEGETCEETQLAWTEEPQEGSEHYYGL